MFNYEKNYWIWNKDIDKVNDYLQFKRIININDLPNTMHAKIYITADTNYALFVNSSFVDCGVYQCGENKFAVDILDILKFLKQGDNTICFSVHYQGVASSQYYKKRAGLLYKLELGDKTYYSDNQTYVREDKSYLTGMYTKTSSQLGFNFLYNATKEDNWINSTIIEEGFESSVCTEIENEIFLKRPIEKCKLLQKVGAEIIAAGHFIRENKEETMIAKLMQSDFLQSSLIKNVIEKDNNIIFYEKSDGAYLLYDLKREEVGLFCIDIDASENTVVDISYGEHLSDLRVRAEIGNRNFANRYICKEGKQSFTYYNTRIAARYIQVHISNSKKVKLNSVSIIPMEYPVKESSYIKTNDALYNKIYDVAKRTLHICMHEHYEDTPWREQALYAMDSRNQALFGYYCFGEYNFAKASFVLLAESIKRDKYIKITAPNSSDYCIPYFSMMWIVEVYEYVLYSADIEFGKSYIKQCSDMIDTYLTNTVSGIPCPPKGKDYWNFYDWEEGLSGDVECDYDILYPLFLLMAMQSYRELAGFCNLDKYIYDDSILTIKDKINTLFWDEDKLMYATFIKDNSKFHYCQLSQALSIITKTCPDNKLSKLRETLVNEDNLVKTTFSLSVFYIQALMGEREKYLDHVLSFVETKWGNMLYNNATSFWETEKGEKDFDEAGSLSHGWSTLPIYVFGAYIGGLVPTLPGFEDFECKPLGEKLSEIKFYSPKYTVEVKKGEKGYCVKKYITDN